MQSVDVFASVSPLLVGGRSVSQDSDDGEHSLVPIRVVIGDAEDGLLAPVDPTPAENEMNKIIHFLTYQRNPDTRPQLVSYYETQRVSEEELPNHLLEEAWTAATDGPLSSYLGDLLDKTEQLQEHLKTLKEGIGSTAESHASDMKALREENGLLTRNVRTLTRKNKYMRIAIVSLSTFSTFLAGVIIWKFIDSK
jgi:hypothetical protein